MSTNRTPQVDLVKLFSSVTSTLQQNQESLNAADEYNHNHGDNMVDNFQAITRAMRATKGSPPAEQLSYASQILNQHSQSGSAQLYSQGLAQAAERFQGKPAVTQEDAMLLVQSLLGGQSAPSAPPQQSEGSAMDLLGSLLGGQNAPQQQGQGSAQDLLGSLLGGQNAPQQGQASGGDMLGGLLGALMGGGSPAQQPNQSGTSQTNGGIDMNMLLTAGMAFFQARQAGAELMPALVQAVMSGSQLQNSAHHSQSGELVATSLLNTIAKMLSSKK